MFNLTIFYNIGLDKGQSYRAIEYAATKMTNNQEWWDSVGNLVGVGDEGWLMDGYPEIVEALNKLWCHLASLDNYEEKPYGDGPLTQEDLDKYRKEFPMSKDELKQAIDYIFDIEHYNRHKKELVEL